MQRIAAAVVQPLIEQALRRCGVKAACDSAVHTAAHAMVAPASTSAQELGPVTSASLASPGASVGDGADKDFLVYRWDEDRYQRYTVDMHSCGPMVLDVLLKIQGEQDPTLFLKVGCRQGRCGACACEVDGRNRLACVTPVDRDAAKVSRLRGLMPPMEPCSAF